VTRLPDEHRFAARRCRHLAAVEATAYDAHCQLEHLLVERLGQSVEVLSLQADIHTPWIATAGSVPDDALTDDWLESIAEYRRQYDAPTFPRHPLIGMSIRRSGSRRDDYAGSELTVKVVWAGATSPGNLSKVRRR